MPDKKETPKTEKPNELLEGVRTRFKDQYGNSSPEDLKRKVSMVKTEKGTRKIGKTPLFELTVCELRELAKGKNTELAKAKMASLKVPTRGGGTKDLPDDVVVNIGASEVAELLS